jgi:hypothetical protein
MTFHDAMHHGQPEISDYGYARIGLIFSEDYDRKLRGSFISGYRSAQQFFNLPVLPPLLTAQEIHQKDGDRAKKASKSWMEKTKPDAVLIVEAQIPALPGELNYRILEDVAVAGSSWDAPVDAGVDQHSIAIGRTALEMLMNLQPSPLEATFQVRLSSGGNASAWSTNINSPTWWPRVALTNWVATGYAAPDGTKWTQVGPAQTTTGSFGTLIAPISAGLFVSSLDKTTLGEAAFENVAATGWTTPAPPPAPTNLTASAGPARISLNWNAVFGASSYNITRSTPNGGPYPLIADSVTTTNYTDTGLLNGVPYYYVVSAMALGGDSVNSTQAAAQPLFPNPRAIDLRRRWRTNSTGVASRSPRLAFANPDECARRPPGDKLDDRSQFTRDQSGSGPWLCPPNVVVMSRSHFRRQPLRPAACSIAWRWWRFIQNSLASPATIDSTASAAIGLMCCN